MLIFFTIFTVLALSYIKKLASFIQIGFLIILQQRGLEILITQAAKPKMPGVLVRAPRGAKNCVAGLGAICSRLAVFAFEK